MVLDKLNLNYDDCALIMRALESYEDNCDAAMHDTVNELWLNVQSECMRLQDVKRRKEQGLAVYVFRDKDGAELSIQEMHDDGEAWRYVYEVLSRYNPTGVTFKRLEDN